MRSAALAVGLLVSPVALMAQAAAAGAKIDSVATQTAVRAGASCCSRATTDCLSEPDGTVNIHPSFRVEPEP